MNLNLNDNRQTDIDFIARQQVNGYYFGPYCLNLDNQCLIVGCNEYPLPCKNYLFLQCLCEANLNNKILDKEYLAERVWQGRFVSDQAIARVVFTTRKMLSECGQKKEIIETVRKRGYRLSAAVTCYCKSDEDSSVYPAKAIVKCSEKHFATI